MVLFLVQKNFVMFGITKNQTNFQFGRMSIIFLLFILNAASSFTYLLTEPNNFKEYIESIYMTSVATMSGVCCATMVFKRKKLFALIQRVEEMLIESESKWDWFHVVFIIALKRKKLTHDLS